MRIDMAEEKKIGTIRKTFTAVRKTVSWTIRIVCVGALLCVALPAFKERIPLNLDVLDFIKDKISSIDFSARKSESAERKTEKEIIRSIPKDKLDKEVCASMEKAYSDAEKYASGKLDEWIDSTMERADSDFLPWYFGYFNMKVRDIKSVAYDIGHKVSSSIPDAETVLIEDLNEALNNRLFQPETTQMKFEAILRETATVYSNSLSAEMAKIPAKYNLTKPEWEAYLNDISHVVYNSGTSMTSLPVKGVVAGTSALGIGAGSLFVKGISAVKNGAVKVFEKATAKKLAKKGIAKTAGKAAGKAAGKGIGKIAGKALGPIITVAIVAWDIADYKMAEKKDKPILRSNIKEYLECVKSRTDRNQVNRFCKPGSVFIHFENTLIYET